VEHFDPCDVATGRPDDSHGFDRTKQSGPQPGPVPGDGQHRLVNVFRCLLMRKRLPGEHAMRRKVIISAISALAVTAIVGALVVTHRLPSKATAAAKPPAVPTAPVVAGTVTSHDVPIYLQGVGTVIAYNTVIVRSQIQGQITKINFTERQTVHTGDL